MMNGLLQFTRHDILPQYHHRFGFIWDNRLHVFDIVGNDGL